MTPPIDILTWQSELASDKGPDNYTMRLLLLAISARMLAAGTQAVRLTCVELAEATGMSREWAMKVARDAVKAGWVVRVQEKGCRQGWKGYTYRPAFHVKQGGELHGAAHGG